jgi:hypothetical protein
MKIKKLSLKKLIGLFSNLNILLSVFSVAFGIVFFLIPVQILLYDIFGILVIIALLIDFFLLFASDLSVNKMHKKGKKINYSSYIFLVLIIYGTLLQIFGILFVNFFLEGFILLLAYIMEISGFFLIHLFGIYFSLQLYQNIDKKEVWKR